MSLNDFLQKHKQSSVSEMVVDGVHEVTRRTQQPRNPPAHIPEQRELIHNIFATDETVWLFFFDGGRYDIFDQLYNEYFTGELQRAYNGGVGFTGDWFDRNMRCDFGNRGLFNYLPIRGMDAVNYDARDYFDIAPDVETEFTREQRLQQLGYLEKSTELSLDVSTEAVIGSVKQYQADVNGGVIRFVKPHPPFDGLEEMTAGTSKTSATNQALSSGDITYQDLTRAYIDTYRTAFESAVELYPELDGEIYITADHGECLTCGQLYHGRNHEKHDHLTTVPWFKVGDLV